MNIKNNAISRLEFEEHRFDATTTNNTMQLFYIINDATLKSNPVDSSGNYSKTLQGMRSNAHSRRGITVIN